MNDVYIKGLKLKNFQSHKDTYIEFTDGLNVIVAPNNTGKSVVFKALHITTLPNEVSREDRGHYIRYGETKATIMWCFSDDSVHIVEVLPSRNHYFYIEDVNLGGRPEFIGEVPNSDLLNKLSIIMHNGLIGNLINTEQDMFLVNSNESTNYSMLSMLIEHEDLQKIINVLEQERIPSAKRLLSDIELKRSSYVSMLSNYRYINTESLTQKIKLQEMVVGSVESLLPALETLEGLSVYSDIDYVTKLRVRLAELLNPVSTGLNSLGNCKDYDRDYSSILNTSSNLIEITKDLDRAQEEIKINTTENQLDALNNLNSISDSLSNVRPVIIKDVTNVLNTVDSLMKIKSSLDVILSKGDLDKKNEFLRKEIDRLGGANIECPIHGTIKFVQGQCIPYNN